MSGLAATLVWEIVRSLESEARGLEPEVWSRQKTVQDEASSAVIVAPRRLSRQAMSMVFDHILGQEPALTSLRRALESGRVHHAYRFEGPNGVGKELAAFAFAQSLLCNEPGAVGCGRCSHCRRAVTFSEEEPHVPLHPDLVVVERGLYPPASLGSNSAETNQVSVAQIRRIVAPRCAFPPHEAKKLVFIFRAAHELSASAANALLKILEEPPSYVQFILLTDRPSQLLDTIRSRSLAIRFAPLPESVVASILERHGRDPRFASMAAGSARHALDLSDPELSESLQSFVDGAEAAIRAPDISSALGFASEQVKNREGLREQLAHLAQHLALSARAALDTDLATGARREELARIQAEQHALIGSAIADLERNGQPALVLESLFVAMRSVAGSQDLAPAD